MTVLLTIGGILGSLGGLGVFLSWWSNRKVGDRPTFVTEAHEIGEQRSQMIAELRQQRADDRADFDRQITEVKTECREQIATVSARVDRCEEEKAEMREDNRVLLAKVRDLIHQLETGR